MAKLLVGTNILVYGIDEDSIFYEKPLYILNYSDFQLVTTSKNLYDFLLLLLYLVAMGSKQKRSPAFLQSFLLSTYSS